MTSGPLGPLIDSLSSTLSGAGQSLSDFGSEVQKTAQFSQQPGNSFVDYLSQQILPRDAGGNPMDVVGRQLPPETTPRQHLEQSIFSGLENLGLSNPAALLGSAPSSIGQALKGGAIATGLTTGIQALGGEKPEDIANPANLATNFALGAAMGHKPDNSFVDALGKKTKKVDLPQPKPFTKDQLIQQDPPLNLKRDVSVTDIYGNKKVIPGGEALTPYQLKGNKVLLKDGDTYVVNKNQYQNIQGNAQKGEATPFAPELEGTEERVLGGPSNKVLKEQMDALYEQKYALEEQAKKDYTDKGLDAPSEITDRHAEIQDAIDRQYKIQNSIGDTKFSQYTLPGGDNYREILIKAPKKEPLDEFMNKNLGPNWAKDVSPEDLAKWREDYERMVGASDSNFQTNHWPGENGVLSHLMVKDRNYKAPNDTLFLEEYQSDWAREGRDQGFQQSDKILKELPEGYTVYAGHIGGEPKWAVKEPNGELFTAPRDSKEDAVRQALGILNRDAEKGIPNHPLLKNWQEMTLKRGLQEAVNTGKKYFAWANGDQIKAKYNLSKQVDKIDWKPQGQLKLANIYTKEAGRIELLIKDGKILEVGGNQASQMNTWKNKDVADAVGKNVAEKINTAKDGVLEGEGLNIGGEWANNLYDKQTVDLVRKLTGQEPKLINMELPISANDTRLQLLNPDHTIARTLTEEDLKPGARFWVNGAGESVVLRLMENGYFKALPTNDETLLARGFFPNDEFSPGTRIGKVEIDGQTWYYNKDTAQFQQFNVNTPKSKGQYAIEITPEVAAKVRGEAPQLKAPSGKSPFNSTVLASMLAPIAGASAQPRKSQDDKSSGPLDALLRYMQNNPGQVINQLK